MTGVLWSSTLHSTVLFKRGVVIWGYGRSIIAQCTSHSAGDTVIVDTTRQQKQMRLVGTWEYEIIRNKLFFMAVYGVKTCATLTINKYFLQKNVICLVDLLSSRKQICEELLAT